MSRLKVLGALAATALVLAACEEDFHTDVGAPGSAAFSNYVAVGTSVSMGVRNGNNAVSAETQQQSWVAQLARQAGKSLKLPLLRSPGCYVPTVAPLAFRLSQASRPGNPLAPDTLCVVQTIAGLAPAPYQNTAISGHTTTQAVYQTPESASVLCPRDANNIPQSPNSTSTCGDHYRMKVVPVVLPRNKSQLGAMVMQNPSFVSVELGANDLLGALSGLVAPGVTVTTEATFSTLYDVIEDSVQKTGAPALLMGLPSDVRTLPSVRLGQEIYDQRNVFLQAYLVNVGADCAAEPGRSNYLFIARVLSAISAGQDTLAVRTRPVNPRPNAPPAPLNCTNVPGVADATFTAADVTTLNTLIAAYNAKIQAVAAANGWAYATIGAPYNQPKPAFSPVTLMTGLGPFGRYISLDGVHPTVEGHRLIANEAIAAINETYGFEIPRIAGTP